MPQISSFTRLRGTLFLHHFGYNSIRNTVIHYFCCVIFHTQILSCIDCLRAFPSLSVVRIIACTYNKWKRILIIEVDAYRPYIKMDVDSEAREWSQFRSARNLYSLKWPAKDDSAVCKKDMFLKKSESLDLYCQQRFSYRMYEWHNCWVWYEMRDVYPVTAATTIQLVQVTGVGGCAVRWLLLNSIRLQIMWIFGTLRY